MKSLNHLTPKKLDKAVFRLYMAHSSLMGVSGLFTQGTRDVCLQDEEYYGIGNLLKRIADELQILEDILRCGYDSTANERNGLEREDDEDADEEEE
ncbi:MAG: hypothetical protein QF441_09730 [Bacteriovoracaceae bacterium]|jgi:hypothetical protein|nr:hypothetical protein [Bacteriovoracaceae bacterium]